MRTSRARQKFMRRFAFAAALLLIVSTGTRAAEEDRDSKVRGDRATVQSAGLWIYNNLAEGFAQAKSSGKPLLIVLRCVP